MDNSEPFSQAYERFTIIVMKFSVHVEPNGVKFDVNSDETILDAAMRQDVPLAYSCRDGLCGACKARLIEGKVSYTGERPEAISEAEVDEGLALLCQAHADSDLRLQGNIAEAVAGFPIRKMPCKVSSSIQLGHDVMRILLNLPDRVEFNFLAGQYIDFLLKDGRRRSYSIANAPHDKGYIELHVRYVAGGEFAEYAFGNMPDKAMLRIEGPLGTFYLREDSDRPLIFMAGGTGFAPIKGLIEHSLEIGQTRPIHLYWGARAKRDLYMHALAQKWADTHPHIHYTPVLSEPMDGDNWDGRTGFVHDAIMDDFEDLSVFDIYAGGPPQMVNAGYDSFSTRGLEPDHYFSDSFEYARDKK